MPDPVTLLDGSLWRKELPLIAVTRFLFHLLNHDWSANEKRITPALGIDNESRKAQKNELNIGRRQIKEYRNSNKGLTMELLCSLLLSQFGGPRVVTSNCETRRPGLPHRYAPSGFTDIRACYPASNGTAAFGLIAEVSAKRQVTKEFYKRQLAQALEHALELAEELAESKAACCPDMPTYALMINGGMIGNKDDKTGLHGIYRSFLLENDIGPDSNVRIIPMFTGDIVFAVASLITTKYLSFGSDKLVMIFDTLHEGLLRDELPNDHEWMSNVWIEVLTTRPTHDQFPPGN